MLLRVKGGHGHAALKYVALRRRQPTLISLEEKKLPRYRSFPLSSLLPLLVGRTTTTGYFCTFPELNGRSNLVPKVG